MPEAVNCKLRKGLTLVHALQASIYVTLPLSILDICFTFQSINSLLSTIIYN